MKKTTFYLTENNVKDLELIQQHYSVPSSAQMIRQLILEAAIKVREWRRKEIELDIEKREKSHED